MLNKFYNKVDSLNLNLIIKKIKVKNKLNSISDVKINNIATLDKSKKNDITFFHSSKYLNLIPKIKTSYVLTNKKFLKFFKKVNIIFL